MSGKQTVHIVPGSTPVDPFISAVAEASKRRADLAEELVGEAGTEAAVFHGNQKSTSFAYTLNNYTVEEYERLKALTCVKYHVIGKEVRHCA